MLKWIEQAWTDPWSPEAWTAIAAWTTLAVALAAAIGAFKQLGEARRTREEEAQPYVVVFMEPTISPEFIDLVIRNLGKTAAYSVKLTSSPPLTQTDGSSTTELWLPEEIPVLVPGQEWRTFWNTAIDRKGKDLPTAHAVEVTYTDSRGKPLTLNSSLDWSVYQGRQWIDQKGLHDAAKALGEIAKVLPKWTNSLNGGLAVYSRDGDAWDQHRSEQLKEAKRRSEEREAERQRRLADDAATVEPAPEDGESS